MSALALMSSRPALRPSFSAANCFSHILSSWRRTVHLSLTSGCSAAIVVWWCKMGDEIGKLSRGVLVIRD